MNDCTPKDTTAIKTPLGMDVDCEPLKETDKWRYADAVGMLQYLSRNTWPDIELAVNQVDRYTHNPKLSHDI